MPFMSLSGKLHIYPFALILNFQVSRFISRKFIFNIHLTLNMSETARVYLGCYMHRPLLFHNQAGWAKAWVEVKARDHKSALRGLRGVSTPSHLRLSLQISQSFRVHFYSFAYGQECCLILVHLIRSLLHYV